MQQPRANALIRILLEDQQADGSFVSYSAPAESGFGAGTKAHTTTFMPALIVGALAAVQDRQVARVRERAVDWLLAQRGPEWSFNYWALDEPLRQTRPYPDDWDDTSCAVAALTLARPAEVTAEVLARLVTLLTNTEMGEGGPYRTWIVPAEAEAHWLDVDVAVNANIAYMLRLHGVDLPNLERLADAAIAEGGLRSPYYAEAGPIEYFLARWYRGKERECLLERIMARQRDGRWEGALESALAVSAALNLGAEPAAVAGAAAWLRGLDEVAAEAFCYDPAIDGAQYVAGSRALTAALVLEAVAKYDAAMRVGSKKTAAKPGLGGRGGRIHEQVLARAMARLEAGGEDMRTAARQIRDRLLGGTAAGQITLLPHLFRQALGERGRGISDERLVDLGTISFYGWLAYTVYDDFLDEEGQPPLLLVANVAMRELVLALQVEAARTPGFGALAWAALDQQEAANAWEVTHCRVRHQSELARIAAPDFGGLEVLAERSMGHALGCVALTMELGYGPDSAEVRAVQEFFRHFLVARQLGDDAHDWKADLRRGQINAVGAHLLSRASRRGLTVPRLYTRLEQDFWERGTSWVKAWTDRELAAARTALGAAAFIARPALLEALLAPVEAAARKAAAQQQQTAEFLRAYRPETSS